MISVQVIANTPTSSEYNAAETLKKIFERETKPNESGKILIVPNVTCYGQETKDIDIVVFGQFQNLARKVVSNAKVGNQKEEPAERMINIQSFCFCIEVKDHTSNGINFSGLCTKVRYKNKWHDATYQSEQQKYSLKNFLEDQMSWSPYICNFIWLRNLTSSDLPNYPNNLCNRSGG